MVLLAATFALVACSGGKNRTLERYYDPQALFSTYLPAGNSVQVRPPQPPSSDRPTILSGVVSSPPQPSPTAATGIGSIGGNLARQAPTDQTVYEMFAVTTDSLSSLDDMTLSFLTGDPSVDVQAEQPISIAGMTGRLVVADIQQGGRAQSSLAAAFTLGRDGTGYIIAALFPPGQWDSERSDFLRVMGSFRSRVPPGIQTIPLAGQSG